MQFIRNFFGSKFITIEPRNITKSLHKVKKALSHGKVVALPTDTLYGLTTLVGYSDKLYKIKGRAENKPLSIFLSDIEEIARFADVTVSPKLLNNLFPGPITILFKRSSRVPADFNPGVDTIGIRIPQSFLIRTLCKYMEGQMIVQTSANVSGSSKSPSSIEDFKDLWDKIDLIVDLGKIDEFEDSHLGSTIVDLSVPGRYKIVRKGCSASKIEEKLLRGGLLQDE